MSEPVDVVRLSINLLPETADVLKRIAAQEGLNLTDTIHVAVEVMRRTLPLSGVTRAVCTRNVHETVEYDLPERPTARTDMQHPFPAEHLALHLDDNRRAYEVHISGGTAHVVFWRDEQMPPWVRATLEPLHPGAFDGWDEHR